MHSFRQFGQKYIMWYITYGSNRSGIKNVLSWRHIRYTCCLIDTLYNNNLTNIQIARHRHILCIVFKIDCLNWSEYKRILPSSVNHIFTNAKSLSTNINKCLSNIIEAPCVFFSVRRNWRMNVKQRKKLVKLSWLSGPVLNLGPQRGEWYEVAVILLSLIFRVYTVTSSYHNVSLTSSQ